MNQLEKCPAVKTKRQKPRIGLPTPPGARYRLARQNRSEPRDHNYDLAFILTIGMNAHASDRKSGAFLFTKPS